MASAAPDGADGVVEDDEEVVADLEAANAHVSAPKSSIKRSGLLAKTCVKAKYRRSLGKQRFAILSGAEADQNHDEKVQQS